MSVHTETSIRSELRNKTMERYYVEKGDIITPSARQFLNEKGIELVVGKPEVKVEAPLQQTEPAFKKKYVCSYTGAYFETKPEHMTHIYGNKLVFKNDPRIVFRGRVDSLQCKILKVQVIARNKNRKKVLDNLEEVLEYTKKILRAEVLEEPLADLHLLGLDEAELRERSHHPQKYYNTGHVMVNSDMDEMVIHLNYLRAQVREVELVALDAFLDNGKLDRPDIMKALNRLSSTIYVMMLQVIAKEY